MQALVETQELRVTSMSTALLTLYIDSAKNLPVRTSWYVKKKREGCLMFNIITRIVHSRK